jgi:Protein of unknown function (DUF1569)
MPVDTTKVQGRRQLNYASLDEIVADAERLSSVPVKTLGNWSAGQVYKHLATAFNGSIDGLPDAFPWHIRLMGRLFKKRLLAGAMPPGFKLPAEFAKAVLPEPTATEVGLAELRAAIARLKRDSRRAKHPVFGNLSDEEWNRIHLMHANLHMSFLAPQ